jgi:hypothetical protein
MPMLFRHLAATCWLALDHTNDTIKCLSEVGSMKFVGADAVAVACHQVASRVLVPGSNQLRSLGSLGLDLQDC